MDVFNTIEINRVQIKVDNETDYYLDEWLYSDYGFRLFYKSGKGANEYYWRKTLDGYEFDENAPYKRIVDIETRCRSIRIQDLTSRSHMLQFVSDNKFYSYLFDYRENMIVMRNDGTPMYDFI
jgi:hypothetical protein